MGNVCCQELVASYLTCQGVNSLAQPYFLDSHNMELTIKTDGNLMLQGNMCWNIASIYSSEYFLVVIKPSCKPNLTTFVASGWIFPTTQRCGKVCPEKTQNVKKTCKEWEEIRCKSQESTELSLSHELVRAAKSPATSGCRV
eukprot:2780366-Amphidinium_carterae.1